MFSHWGLLRPAHSVGAARLCRPRDVPCRGSERAQPEERHRAGCLSAKFHPELNPIERYWAALKDYLRVNTQYEARGLRKLLVKALTEGVPADSFGRYFRASGRIASAYRLGCNYELARWATQKCRSHRCIPPERMKLLREEFDKKAAGQRAGPAAAVVQEEQKEAKPAAVHGQFKPQNVGVKRKRVAHKDQNQPAEPAPVGQEEFWIQCSAMRKGKSCGKWRSIHDDDRAKYERRAADVPFSCCELDGEGCDERCDWCNRAVCRGGCSER